MSHRTSRSRTARPAMVSETLVRPVVASDVAAIRAFMTALTPAERDAAFGTPVTDGVLRAFRDMEVRADMSAVLALSDGAVAGVAVIMSGAGTHSARIAVFLRGTFGDSAALATVMDEALRIAAATADEVTVPVADAESVLAFALRLRGALLVARGQVVMGMLRVGNDAYRWIRGRMDAEADARAARQAGEDVGRDAESGEVIPFDRRVGAAAPVRLSRSQGIESITDVLFAQARCVVSLPDRRREGIGGGAAARSAAIARGRHARTAECRRATA